MAEETRAPVIFTCPTGKARAIIEERSRMGRYFREPEFNMAGAILTEPGDNLIDTVQEAREDDLQWEFDGSLKEKHNR